LTVIHLHDVPLNQVRKTPTRQSEVGQIPTTEERYIQ
jgi:hypothetical protein